MIVTYKNFRAELVDKNLIGCNFYFHVFKNEDDTRVGNIDGNNPEMMFEADKGSMFTTEDLQHLGQLIRKVYTQISKPF